MIFNQGRKFSLRRTALLTGDVCCIFVGIFLSAVIRLGFDHALLFCVQHYLTMLGSAAIFLVVFYASGMYERQALTRKDGSYLLPLIAVLIGLTLTILVFYARYHLGIGRGILAMAGIFIFLSTWAMRYAYRMAAGYGLLSKRTLVVGDGQELEDVIRLVNRTADAGLKLVGCATARKTPVGTFIAGVPVVGMIEKLRECADAFEVETIVVATSLAREHSLLRMLRPLRWSGIEVMDYVTLHESLAQEIPIHHINDEWLMNAAMNSSVIHIRKIKRIMDISVSALGLLLSFPICLLASVLIRLDSPGPIFFRQRRSGLDGRVYTLFKFRTMRQDAEAQSGAVWAGRHDNRVTRIGRYFRNWRIDEIPQLINVLRGEMSLVGPRPERPEFVDTLDSAIPFYKERLLVPPGVTGWAQVKYPYAASIEAARRKLQYDIYYIKHMSFWLDCLILLRTVKTILVGMVHSEQVAPDDSSESGQGGAIAMPEPDAPIPESKTA